MKLFDQIKLRLSKSAPVEKWTGSMNYPFYGHLDQPRPSLSKHNYKEMLHCDDLIFILTARSVVPKLLEALDIAIETLDGLSDSRGTAAVIAEESLKKIEAINEES